MSESSRLGRTVEIGDLDDTDAIHYLIDRKVPQDQAQAAVGIVGGRLRMLKDARTRLLEGQSVSGTSLLSPPFLTPLDLRNALLGEAKDKIRQADLILAEDPAKITERQRVAWAELIRIMDSPQTEVPADLFAKKVGGAAVADDLLRTNVFSYHHNKGSVGMQSRPMQLYLAGEIGPIGSPQRSFLQTLLRDASRRPSSREDI